MTSPKQEYEECESHNGNKAKLRVDGTNLVRAENYILEKNSSSTRVFKRRRRINEFEKSWDAIHIEKQREGQAHRKKLRFRKLERVPLKRQMKN
jgi:hypothetical protein